MASTYSPNLALTLIGTGDQAGAWGNTTNVNLGTLLEQAISGYVTQTIADVGDTTITIPNGATGVARNMAIECTGTLTAGRNLLVPNNKKLYVIYNNTTGGYAVTVKVAGQTGVSVPNGKKMILVCDGTDIVNAINYLSGTATNITGVAAVANGGTGVSTVPANGQILIGNGTGYSVANIQAGANVTVTNSAGGITISATGGGGGGGGVSGVTATAPLASSGGSVPDISLSGTVPVANGGTGAATLTGYVKGNGTSAMTASSTIPGSDISGNITGNAAGLSSTLGAASGGTGNTSYTQGQILIGNSAGTLTKNTITAGSGISITNGDGAITITASGAAGVSSFSAGSTGLTPSTGTTGAVTLGGTLAVASGGTGSTTTSGARTALDVPSTTGSGASGTWSISINGNAATVTNGVVTSGSYANPSWITSLASSKLSGAVAVGTGGTGVTTTPTNGQLLIGNGSGYTVANLTAGSNITITNSSGGISIAATGGSGTVTSVGGTGTVNGITLTGTVTSTGNLTLGGTLSGVSLTSQVSGTLPVANGGTGQTSGSFLKYSSSGSSAVVTASTSSPTGGSDGDIWLKY